MTKEEIAKDLVKKFNSGSNSTSQSIKAMSDMFSKEHAIICAKEIKERMPFNQQGYWDDIIKEIEKL